MAKPLPNAPRDGICRHWRVAEVVPIGKEQDRAAERGLYPVICVECGMETFQKRDYYDPQPTKRDLERRKNKT